MELINLTFAERAVLSNQFEILSHLDPDQKEIHLMKRDVIDYGFTALYSEALSPIDTKEIEYDVCEETFKILNMFRVINPSLSEMSEEVKKELDVEAILFNGFDANNDDHYSLTTFMVEKQSKFSELADINLNSHSHTSLIRYRKMLPVFRDLYVNKNIHTFGKSEIEKLIEAANS